MAKKRFTIMLDENTIAKIKQLYKWYNPVTVREELQRVLEDYATDEILSRDWRESYDK